MHDRNTAPTIQGMADRAEDRPARTPVEPAGGDPACWLHRVCPACGRVADDEPPTRCPGCGELIDPA